MSTLEMAYQLGALAQAARNYIITRDERDLVTLDRLAAEIGPLPCLLSTEVSAATTK